MTATIILYSSINWLNCKTTHNSHRISPSGYKLPTVSPNSSWRKNSKNW